MTEPSSGLVSDLQVESVSTALAGRTLDVVIAGSIGAVESVRFVRSLRRLGANVVPWLTDGGAQFVTETALAWAAGRPVRRTFAGEHSHLALADACLIAPASASLLGRLAHGLTDTPSSALITSYLGSRRPVMLLPNMHDSLAAAPAVMANLQLVGGMGVQLLSPRREEGKHKFPDPATLADEVAHRLNAGAVGGKGVLITMGSTRGYIDDVRYLSNYSSGALGSAIAEELYRLGYTTHVVAGPSPRRPKVYSHLVETLTNDDMATAAHAAMAQGAQAAIMAASVLDFQPSQRASGKISSRGAGELTVTLQRTAKIIADIHPSSGIKVGFKLETQLTPQRVLELAEQNMRSYQLSFMVLNDLAQVDAHRHSAYVLTRGDDGQPTAATIIHGKRAVACAVSAHVDAGLRGVAASR